MRGVGGKVFVAFGFGLGLMGTAWAQPTPPAGGAKPQPATTSTKLVEGKRSQYRRATKLAAKKFFKAQEDRYNSLCKSQAAQDDAQAALDAAKRELDLAIEFEAEEVPEVKRLKEEAEVATIEYMSASAFYEAYDARELLKAANEATARFREALAREAARIRARIAESTDTPAPRRTSCGPGIYDGTQTAAERYYATIAELRSKKFIQVDAATTQLIFGGRSTTFNVPTINAGTVFSGGAERPIISSASRLSGGGGVLSFSTPGTGPISNIVFTGTFDQANASGNGFVAPGTNGVGQTYIFPNPVSGSTGINAGATGQSVSTETQWREFSGTIAGRTEIALTEVLRQVRGGYQGNQPQVTLAFGAGVHYRNTRRTDTITQQSINFAGLNSVIDLSATSNFIAPQLSAGFVVTPGGPSGPFGGLSGSVAPGFDFNSASATQNSRCTPCGGGSPELNVTLQRDFSSNKFAVISGVTAYVGYQLNPGAKLLLEATYENQTGAPVFSVPTTPTQQPITLGAGSVDTFRAGGKFIVSFPPPPPP